MSTPQVDLHAYIEGLVIEMLAGRATPEGVMMLIGEQVDALPPDVQEMILTQGAATAETAKFYRPREDRPEGLIIPDHM
jgi:hypothetical protein